MTPKSALLTTFLSWANARKSGDLGQFFESPNKLLKMHVLGQNELNKRSKHTRAPKSAQNAFFVTVLVSLQICLLDPWRAKVTKLRPLHVFRVLSVWAENWYGSSLGQVKALTQFSAQTDNTRKTWRGLKSAIMALFKNGQKVAFWEKVVVRVNFGHFWC